MPLVQVPNTSIKFSPSATFDLQVNGGLGIDFSDPKLEVNDVVKTCEFWHRHGTTHFLATIITAAHETYLRNVRVIADAMNQGCPGLVGIHLEGPHLSPQCPGAHPPSLITPPDLGKFQSILEAAQGKVLMTTVASDVEKMPEFIRDLKNLGIVVSLGHHAGNRTQIKECIAAGATGFTHMGNAWSKTGWSAKSTEAITMATYRNTYGMLIGDREHVPAEFIDTIFEAKGPEHTIFVSDASPLAGVKPGKYNIFGGVEFEVADSKNNPGHLRTYDLSGSYMTLAQCMNFIFHDCRGISPEQIWRAVNMNPIAFLAPALERIKALEFGTDHVPCIVDFTQDGFALVGNAA